MKKKLPVKNYINELKKFFSKLLDKNKKHEKTINNSKENNYNSTNFNDTLKVTVKNEYLNNLKKEDFLNKIENNPNLLYELPIEKLEKLDKYYDELISNYENELFKLKKVNSNK